MIESVVSTHFVFIVRKHDSEDAKLILFLEWDKHIFILEQPVIRYLAIDVETLIFTVSSALAVSSNVINFFSSREPLSFRAIKPSLVTFYPIIYSEHPISLYCSDFIPFIPLVFEMNALSVHMISVA